MLHVLTYKLSKNYTYLLGTHKFPHKRMQKHFIAGGLQPSGDAVQTFLRGLIPLPVDMSHLPGNVKTC